MPAGMGPVCVRQPRTTTAAECMPVGSRCAFDSQRRQIDKQNKDRLQAEIPRHQDNFIFFTCFPLQTNSHPSSVHFGTLILDEFPILAPMARNGASLWRQSARRCRRQLDHCSQHWRQSVRAQDIRTHALTGMHMHTLPPTPPPTHTPTHPLPHAPNMRATRDDTTASTSKE